ncbi:MAG: SEC59/DGK1/VTE5 family protein [Leptolyngbyaceae bacterium]|nr:SEC59/DGK1/VTE5 family protein [Leptolyngbyaceae bacterium]
MSTLPMPTLPSSMMPNPLPLALTALTLLDSVPMMKHLGIVVLWLSLVITTTVTAKHWAKDRPEVPRKILHIGSGNVILLAWWMQIPAWAGILASLGASAITLLSYKFPVLPLIDSVGRKSLGTFFYAMSIGILIAVFWPMGMPYYAVIGVLVMTWGDGMAALVGQRWGRHSFTVWGMKKSWEGTLAMAIASYTVSGLTLWAVQGATPATWGIAAAIALCATLLELLSKLGIDNLTVPLGSGAIAFWLNHLWLGL